MNINWQVRIHNPIWWTQMFLSVSSPILAYYGLNFKDLSSWRTLFNLFLQATKNPYIVGLILINIFNTINDPTTKGFSDSNRALDYVKPN